MTFLEVKLRRELYFVGSYASQEVMLRRKLCFAGSYASQEYIPLLLPFLLPRACSLTPTLTPSSLLVNFLFNSHTSTSLFREGKGLVLQPAYKPGSVIT